MPSLKKFTVAVQTRFEKEVVDKMDEVIKAQKFDDRSQFIRMAVNEEIRRRTKPIMA